MSLEQQDLMNDATDGVLVMSHLVVRIFTLELNHLT